MLVDPETKCINCYLAEERGIMWLNMYEYCVHVWDDEQCKKEIEIVKMDIEILLRNI